LTCWRQALMILVWFRKNEDKTLLAAGFGVSRATAYRYVAEGIKNSAAQAPDLHDALKWVADDGWSHVTTRCSAPTGCPRPPPVSKAKPSTPGTPVNTVDPAPTFRRSSAPTVYRCGPPTPHPDTCRTGPAPNCTDIPGALYWAASQLHLPTLADTGYDGAGHGIHTPYEQPTDGVRLATDNRAYNSLLRSLRCQGERGFAILTARWRALRHTTASPPPPRRSRPRRPRTHPFRIPASTESLLRSRRWNRTTAQLPYMRHCVPRTMNSSRSLMHSPDRWTYLPEALRDRLGPRGSAHRWTGLPPSSLSAVDPPSWERAAARPATPSGPRRLVRTLAGRAVVCSACPGSMAGAMA
jgi:hypothetical protein